MNNDQARLYLQEVLETTFPSLPVHFSPPGNYILKRPCIVYSLQQRDPSYANNSPYSIGKRFQVTVLSDRPGIDGLDAMYSMPNVIVTGHNSYVTNDISHEVFTVSINTI
jgi:hypothetical protein